MQLWSRSKMDREAQAASAAFDEADQTLTAAIETRTAKQAAAETARMRYDDARESVADAEKALFAAAETEARAILAGSSAKSIGAATLKVRAERQGLEDARGRVEILRKASDQADAQLAEARAIEDGARRRHAVAKRLHTLMQTFVTADRARPMIVKARAEYDAAVAEARAALAEAEKLITNYSDDQYYPRSERLLTQAPPDDPPPSELVEVITLAGCRDLYRQFNPNSPGYEDNIIPMHTVLLIPASELAQSPHLFQLLTDYEREKAERAAEAAKQQLPPSPAINHWWAQQREFLKRDRESSLQVLWERLINPFAKSEQQTEPTINYTGTESKEHE